MLNGRGVLKISDFGIACSLVGSVARVSQWSSSAGTLVYMSPQQMWGERPSHLDDIYALGATIYEMVAGKPPFHSGNITLQVKEVTPESMTSRRGQMSLPGKPIPASWEETIAACLAKDPAERPQSAGEVLRRLQGRSHRTFVPVDIPVFDEHTAYTQVAAASSQHWDGVPTPPPRAAGVSLPPVSAPVSLKLHLSARNAALAALALALVLLAALLAGKRGAPSVSAVPAPAPVPAAAVPLASRGGLTIATSPPGATVELGGEALETTPAVFKAISSGSYPVTISLAGYQPVRMQAEIKPNQFTDLGTLTLRHETGTLQLTASPGGASYELKNLSASGDAPPARTGQTPENVVDLPTGTYAVTFKHAGWPDQVKTVEVTSGAVLPVAGSFASGTLSVRTDPPGASIRIGERVLGTTPLNVELPPGQYREVQVVLDGFIPASLDAEVRQGETAAPPVVPLQKLVTALQLSSSPAGLDYLICAPDGTPVRNGQTPAAIFDLPAGDYVVTFQRPGWTDFTSPLRLEPQKPVSLGHDFPEGSVSVTSEPGGAEIFLGAKSLGVAPLTAALPPGASELTAQMPGMPARKHTVIVTEGEESALAFNMKSGGTSASAHHHRRVPKQQPSALAKLGDSIKTFFSAGSGNSPAKKPSFTGPSNRSLATSPKNDLGRDPMARHPVAMPKTPAVMAWNPHPLCPVEMMPVVGSR